MWSKIQNLDDLRSFRSRTPSRPEGNMNALALAIEGIEATEFPTQGIGMPTSLLEILGPVDSIAMYIGLGDFKQHGVWSSGKRKIIPATELMKDYDATPETYNTSKTNNTTDKLIKSFIKEGFEYNAIRLLNNKIGQKGNLNTRLSNVSDRSKAQTLQTINAAINSGNVVYPSKHPCVDIQEGIKAYMDNEGQFETSYLFKLLQGIKADRSDNAFVWQLENGYGVRHRFMSESRGREGQSYTTWEVYDKNKSFRGYFCDCPAMKECWHIKAAKSIRK